MRVLWSGFRVSSEELPGGHRFLSLAPSRIRSLHFGLGAQRSVDSLRPSRASPSRGPLSPLLGIALASRLGHSTHHCTRPTRYPALGELATPLCAAALSNLSVARACLAVTPPCAEPSLPSITSAARSFASRLGKVRLVPSHPAWRVVASSVGRSWLHAALIAGCFGFGVAVVPAAPLSRRLAITYQM